MEKRKEEELARYKEALLKEGAKHNKEDKWKELASKLHIKQHIRFFAGHLLKAIPEPYVALDHGRINIIYFALAGLDILNALDMIVTETQKEAIIDWVYRTQKEASGGFTGSYSTPSSCYLSTGHLAYTYTSLCVLVILGDDLKRVDRKAMQELIRDCQDDNEGNFKATRMGSEKDIRFSFCAAAICTILNDWTGFDKEKAFQFITKARSYDKAFGHGPFAESHSGSTYCAISSLHLMGMLDRVDDLEETLYWLLQRQKRGFQGRANKDEDTCYSFWAGAIIHQLGGIDHVKKISSASFTLSCQDTEKGGIRKSPQVDVEIVHSYFGLAGLSLLSFGNLAPLEPCLGLTKRAAAQLK